ncbi:hypothetical protein BBK82_24950 [Lentzea guizhouensis]|uniref:NACHT domain-containing protein n=1 Tax=Lentzea guizhouensis TaxID=1586287 RepID=A0A1B2HMA1_9PSEU|nr:NACHT domain-containing protein [Lentzea guizhouensis]ANZ38830.1 hypothetical protein BBK82_24950 [Lentzea guizhouensis]
MHNEVNSPVHGVVFQSRDIYGAVNVGAVEPEYPPLTSWRDRPELTRELEELLKVQRDTAVTLPHHLQLLKKQPRLIDVYVQRSVLPQRHEEPEPDPEQGDSKAVDREPKHSDSVMSLREALATGRHLLITGGPGSGKSTLGHMYVQVLADEWLEPSGNPPLAEPLMPLRVSAKALIGEESWSELLAKAVRSNKLNAPPRPELFARPALGARWLVFVDGLDEIVEPDHLRQVIDALTSRIRHGSEHQLVITSRDLASGVLDQLQVAHLDRYRIEPFGVDQLEQFAQAWFQIQDPTRVAERKREFLRQVMDGRLRELVTVPLFATIAAIANTLEPERELPQNRVDLCERFLTYLLDEKLNQRTTITELRRTIDDPERLELVEWIYANRAELIEHLAVERLDSELPLAEIATEWIKHPSPPEDLEAVLTSIGVFAQTGEGIDFLHRLFAEYLAARAEAPRIPADFPQLDMWVERGTNEAKETFVLFTFVLWSRVEGNDIGLVVERLLNRGRKHVLLGAKLFAENVDVPAEQAAHLVDRLVDLILTINPGSDPWSEVNDVCRAVRGLTSTVIADGLTARLRELQQNPELLLTIRICCAVALEQLEAGAGMMQWLEKQFFASSDPAVRRAVALGLAEILPDGANRAEQLVVQDTDEADKSDYARIVANVRLLLDLKRPDPAARLLRRMVKHVRQESSATPGSSHLPRQVSNLGDQELISWFRLLRLATDARCTDEALLAADMILARQDAESHELRAAVMTLMSHGGATAVDRIVEQVQDRSAEHKLAAATTLFGDHQDAAAELARGVAVDPDTTDYAKVTACVLIAEVDPMSTSALLDGVDDVSADLTAPLAALVLQGVPSAKDLFRKFLARKVTEWDFSYIAESALELDGFSRDVHVVTVGGSEERWAEVAPLLYRAGHHELGEDLVERLIGQRAPDPAALASCADSLLSQQMPEQAKPLLEKLMTLVGSGTADNARLVAPILQEYGRTEEAVTVAEQALLRELADGGLYVEECVGILLDIAGSKRADFIAEQVANHAMSMDRRLAVAGEFRQRGLFAHMAATWLDVLRHHAFEIKEGVETANKLVKCGYRQQAIEVVREVLDKDELTPSQRPTVRALLAWLEAMGAE